MWSEIIDCNSCNVNETIIIDCNSCNVNEAICKCCMIDSTIRIGQIYQQPRGKHNINIHHYFKSDGINMGLITSLQCETKISVINMFV